MSRTWQRKLLFSLCTSIFLFSSAELLLRGLYGKIGQDVYVYSGIGEYTDWLVEVGEEVRPVYMHQPLSFPQDSPYHRLAFLGGSSVHGGTPTATLQQEFPHLVGKKLKMQSWNLGSPSIDSHDVLRIVEELQQYRFDAWVIYLGHNDFGNTYFFQRFSNWNATYTVAWDSFFRRFQLYRLLSQIKKKSGNGLIDGLGKSNMSGDLIDRKKKNVALQLLLENVEHIIRASEKGGVPILFVIPAASWMKAPLGRCVPQKKCALDDYKTGMKLLHTNPEEARSYLSSACSEDGIPLRILPEAQDALRDIFERRGVPYIDGHRDLPRESGIDLPSQGLFYDHVHFSNKGHEEMATLIANKLSIMLER